MRTLQDVKRTTWHGRTPFNVLRLAANVADGETVTIGQYTFEFDSNSSYTAGRIPIVVGTLTPTAVMPLLVSAINAYTPYQAVQISVNEMLLVAKDDNTPIGAVACTETMAGANNAWGTATMTAGLPAGALVNQLQQRAATAQDVSIGFARFWFPFTVAAAFVEVRTSAGVKRAWDGAVTFSGGVVSLDNAGATDWVAGDLLVCLASS
jgi:hypothetical protein